ncbi:hypothetical protein HaLaN_28860, partial [Haematococcus lacustris]
GDQAVSHCGARRGGVWAEGLPAAAHHQAHGQGAGLPRAGGGAGHMPGSGRPGHEQ